MIRSGLGLGPWDAFHFGLHRLTGLTIGMASILAGVLVVGISIALRSRPGPATLANMVLIGVFTDIVLRLLPAAGHWGAGVAYHLGGIALMGLATGMYISAGLGAGPRDGLMAALSARYHWSIQRTRTLIELSVLAAGWAMGGVLGVGTVMFAVLVGPSVQWGMRVFGLVKRDGSAPTADPGRVRSAPQGDGVEGATGDPDSVTTVPTAR